MNKSVSFSLYGTSDYYLNKFFENFECFKKYFFDYQIILHADFQLKNQVEKFCLENHVELFYEHQKYDSDGMFWRYNPILSKKYDLVLVRDIDYLPSKFEMDLIQQFIDSDFNFHIIRAHNFHKMPIMGGLFAIKRPLFDVFSDQLYKWKVKNGESAINYNDDQLFLADYVYGKFLKTSLIHSSSNVFWGESPKIIYPPKGFIIGGDERHPLSYEDEYLNIYLPVCLLKIMRYRGLNYIKFKYSKMSHDRK